MSIFTPLITALASYLPSFLWLYPLPKFFPFKSFPIINTPFCYIDYSINLHIHNTTHYAKNQCKVFLNLAYITTSFTFPLKLIIFYLSTFYIIMTEYSTNKLFNVLNHFSIPPISVFDI